MAMFTAFDQNASLGVLGSGDFARALATRCYENGIPVVIGSRHPEQRRSMPQGDIFTKVKVCGTEECIKTCDVLFLAMQPQYHCQLQEYSSFFPGKILIDISNSMIPDKKSNAEVLADLYPDARVVKAFNTISAYGLTEELDSTTPVFVCSNDQEAKAVVMTVAGRLGFSPIDFGQLERASQLEKRNRTLFAGWGGATIVTGVFTLIWTVLAFLRYFDWRNPPYTWERLPTNVINKVMACMSLTLLCFVYIPGAIAGFIQLSWGTKHRRFHKSLDNWLKMRKQLGLYALLFGVVHLIMSTVLLSPAYYSDWYLKSKQTVPANHTDDVSVGVSSRMNAAGETCVLLGVLAITMMALLGITSLPSVAKTLNWREWRFVQSYVGIACLVLATAHVTVKGGAVWIHKEWHEYVPTLTFMVLPLPWFTILLRLLLFLPCCHIKLQKIRGGYEKKRSTKDDDGTVRMTRITNGAHPSGSKTDETLNIGTINPAFNA